MGIPLRLRGNRCLGFRPCAAAHDRGGCWKANLPRPQTPSLCVLDKGAQPGTVRTVPETLELFMHARFVAHTPRVRHRPAHIVRYPSREHSSPRGRSAGLVEESRHGDPECFSQGPQFRDADLTFAAFDESHDGAMQFGGMRKLLLRQMTVLPQLADPPTERDEMQVALLPVCRHPATLEANPQRIDCGSAASRVAWASKRPTG